MSSNCLDIRAINGILTKFEWKEIEYIRTYSLLLLQVICIKVYETDKELIFPYYSFFIKPFIKAINELELQNKIKKY